MSTNTVNDRADGFADGKAGALRRRRGAGRFSIRKIIPRPLRHAVLGLMARVGYALGRVIPRGVGLALFSALGTVCYYILSSDRKKTIRHLRLVFGNEWDDGKIRATAKKVFRTLGKNIFDGVYLSTLDDKRYNAIVTHDSVEPIVDALAEGRGGLLVTAHIGCFENILHFFAQKGFGGVAVGRAFKNAAVDEVVRKMRSGPNIVYLDKSENPRQIVRVLKEGRLMGVLLDQDTTDVEGVFADFLGRPAFSPSGAVRFAMKFKLPIIVAVTVRMTGDKHHVFISPQLECADTGDFENDLVTNVTKINDMIGGYIRKYPEQWVWMHERWKTKPRQVAGEHETVTGHGKGD